MLKLSINVFSSSAEQEKYNKKQYRNMKPAEKWAELQFLRTIYSKVTNQNGKNRKRLRRIITIIQQA